MDFAHCGCEFYEARISAAERCGNRDDDSRRSVDLQTLLALVVDGTRRNRPAQRVITFGVQYPDMVVFAGANFRRVVLDAIRAVHDLSPMVTGCTTIFCHWRFPRAWLACSGVIADVVCLKAGE